MKQSGNHDAYRMAPVLALLLGALAGCASQKTPATADVAVSRAAVDAAANAGAAEVAPAEMQSARDKLMRANQALTARDYQAAADWANQAEADARLAQSKANSAKAAQAAEEVQRSIQALRDELSRSSAPVTR
ncbi:DUF4398 domain-containing protein [Pseudoduganella sp. FT93W]|uniref:DUF4398 domain-containing protein n=1 Tax=Duganella fentianensis TaxID=2692177 RepID=A0A845HU33_9BURK|nr:DUF4398 domain-containing protein [Duganella fentianensis]MYN44513.1 DUF4398 domain-containing protein [Duganella fentianensis]